MARMMSRIAVSSPPGVSICNTTTRLPFTRAASRALVTNREVAGPMAPLISRTVAVAAPVFGAPVVVAPVVAPVVAAPVAAVPVLGAALLFFAGWDAAVGTPAAGTGNGIS